MNIIMQTEKIYNKQYYIKKLTSTVGFSFGK